MSGTDTPQNQHADLANELAIAAIWGSQRDRCVRHLAGPPTSTSERVLLQWLATEFKPNNALHDCMIASACFGLDLGEAGDAQATALYEHLSVAWLPEVLKVANRTSFRRSRVLRESIIALGEIWLNQANRRRGSMTTTPILPLSHLLGTPAGPDDPWEATGVWGSKPDASTRQWKGAGDALRQLARSGLVRPGQLWAEPNGTRNRTKAEELRRLIPHNAVVLADSAVHSVRSVALALGQLLGAVRELAISPEVWLEPEAAAHVCMWLEQVLPRYHAWAYAHASSGFYRVQPVGEVKDLLGGVWRALATRPDFRVLGIVMCFLFDEFVSASGAARTPEDRSGLRLHLFLDHNAGHPKKPVASLSCGGHAIKISKQFADFLLAAGSGDSAAAKPVPRAIWERLRGLDKALEIYLRPGKRINNRYKLENVAWLKSRVIVHR